MTGMSPTSPSDAPATPGRIPRLASRSTVPSFTTVWGLSGPRLRGIHTEGAEFVGLDINSEADKSAVH